MLDKCLRNTRINQLGTDSKVPLASVCFEVKGSRTAAHSIDPEISSQTDQPDGGPSLHSHGSSHYCYRSARSHMIRQRGEYLFRRRKYPNCLKVTQDKYTPQRTKQNGSISRRTALRHPFFTHPHRNYFSIYWFQSQNLARNSCFTWQAYIYHLQLDSPTAVQKVFKESWAKPHKNPPATPGFSQLCCGFSEQLWG